LNEEVRYIPNARGRWLAAAQGEEHQVPNGSVERRVLSGKAEGRAGDAVLMRRRQVRVAGAAEAKRFALAVVHGRAWPQGAAALGTALAPGEARSLALAEDAARVGASSEENGAHAG